MSLCISSGTSPAQLRIPLIHGLFLALFVVSKAVHAPAWCVPTNQAAIPNVETTVARKRDAFDRVEPLLNLFAKMLGLLPRKVASSTWWMVQSFPGLAGYGLRFIWAKRLAKSTGRAVKIGTGTIIRNWHGLELGDHVGINENCYIDAIGGIKIGPESGLGHCVSIVSFEHSWNDTTQPMRGQKLDLRPVEIGSDTMITMGVRVLGGRKVGSRSIVSANSVVVKNVPDNEIWGGIPAKFICPVKPKISVEG